MPTIQSIFFEYAGILTSMCQIIIHSTHSPNNAIPDNHLRMKIIEDALDLNQAIRVVHIEILSHLLA